MSFAINCSGCGALSGPSVGICPFCKTVMTTEASNPKESSIVKIYQSGRYSTALMLAKKYYENDTEKKDVSFLLLYTKILIDTEAPSSKIKSVLAEAHLTDPTSNEVLDYLDYMEAKSLLRKGLNDPGEMQLRQLIRKSPNHIHALFTLGTHLFWVEEQARMALGYLESCIRLQPNFIRAWGCLGAIYKTLGNENLSVRAFEKCISLETDHSMKQYFQEQIDQQKAA